MIEVFKLLNAWFPAPVAGQHHSICLNDEIGKLQLNVWDGDGNNRFIIEESDLEDPVKLVQEIIRLSRENECSG